MKMLLAVPALALLAAPAFAKPDLPYRPEVRMHLQADGRADLHVDAASRPDAYARTVENVTGSNQDRFGRGSHVVLPIKNDVAMKLQTGDNRENAVVQKSAAKVTAGQVQTNNPYANIRPSHFVLPLKTDIALKLHSGDNRESSVAHTGNAAKPADRDGKSAHQPLSKSQKTALCQQTGVCLPFLQGSSDSEDKTE